MKLPNPFQKFIRPQYHGERDRILTQSELEKLWESLKSTDALWEPRKAKNNINPHLLPLAKLALETAMRRSEMLELTWDRVDLERRVAYLLKTKNGKPRTVPLSTGAIAVFQEVLEARKKMPLEGLEAASNRVFPISYRVVDQAWVRAVKRAGDLPPANRASRNLVKFVFGEDEHEEALFGRANHWLSEGSRGRYAGQGTVQEARVQ
ncbi:hypothetical protein A8D82_28460 [Burkholderia cenocepacia]|nr:hypothetical protein A8D82_28460 [Burkholderia cenocepacia]